MADFRSKAGAGASEYISFCLGAQEFCIDIASVREIRSWTQVTPLPHAPSYVRGVINLRGSVLPIMDLSERLGTGQTTDASRQVIIVVEAKGQTVGLLVDAVSDILSQSPDNIQPTPDLGGGTVTSYISGMLAIEGRMIALVKLDGVIPDAMQEAA